MEEKTILFLSLFFVFIISCSLFPMGLSHPSDGGYQDGWPQMIGGEIESSPVFANVDGGSHLEVVVGAGTVPGKLYVFKHDGNTLNGFPQETDGLISTSPAVGDIDGDGDMEIVVGAWNRKVYAWHHNGSLVEGWPKSTVGSITRASPSLYDLDGDGTLEIICGSGMSSYGSNDGRLYVWHHNGSLMWSKVVLSTYSTPAIGDVDNDGKPEVVIGNNKCGDVRAKLYVFNHDGTPLDNWPFVFPSNRDYASPVALADFDGDGCLEMVAMIVQGGPPPACETVYIFNRNKTILAGWPKIVGRSETSPAVGDIDNDCELEIVIGSSEYPNQNAPVYAWNADGSSVRGWPVRTDDNSVITTSPTLADIDGDGDIDIVATSSTKLYAWSYKGQRIAGFPKALDKIIYRSSPCVGDIDGDGDLEVAVGCWDGRVYMWDLQNAYQPDTLEWPMFQHDPRHTGRYVPTNRFISSANGPYYSLLSEQPVEFTGFACGGSPPYSWHWDFGDGSDSTRQNPEHTYGKKGTYAVTLMVSDNEHNTSADATTAKIVEDATSPYVSIATPTKAIYVGGTRLVGFPVPVVIGPMEIEVVASDHESGMDRVEIYIDDHLKETDAAKPYSYSWNERILPRRHTLRTVAYDKVGNCGTDEIVVWKFL